MNFFKHDREHKIHDQNNVDDIKTQSSFVSH